MNEQMRDKLDQDLRKSGFYSEMMAIHTCTAAKWQCHGSFTYFDKDERSTRECDFEAVKEWRGFPDDDKTQVMARLIGQVKKSDVPWIVFIDRHPRRFRFRDGLDNVIHTSAARGQRMGKALQEHSLAEQNGWIGSGIHEAFKKPSDNTRWYSAFVTACKAAESAFDTAVTASRPAVHFELIKPVVILDGLLIAAELSTGGELVLTEMNDAQFEFEYRSDAYERPRYYLDVVTLAAFPRYLEFIEARIAAVINALQSQGVRDEDHL